jgi:hypothetical protein
MPTAPDYHGSKPAVEVIAALLADNDRLRRGLAYLQGKGVDIETFDAPPWARGLTPQEIEFIGILEKAYPGWVSTAQANRRLGGYGVELSENSNRIAMLVRRVRHKLCEEAIESAQGKGYRLGPAVFRAVHGGVL